MNDFLDANVTPFLLAWAGLGDGRLPEPELEYVFHPNRKWRFDVCWPHVPRGGRAVEVRVAVEIDGGTQMVRRNAKGQVAIGGRHNTDEDRWKLAEAAMLGWRVIRFSHTMLSKDPARCVRVVARALGYDPDEIAALRPTEAEQIWQTQQKRKRKK